MNPADKLDWAQSVKDSGLFPHKDQNIYKDGQGRTFRLVTLQKGDMKLRVTYSVPGAVNILQNSRLKSLPRGGRLVTPKRGRKSSMDPDSDASAKLPWAGVTQFATYAPHADQTVYTVTKGADEGQNYVLVSSRVRDVKLSVIPGPAQVVLDLQESQLRRQDGDVYRVTPRKLVKVKPAPPVAKTPSKSWFGRQSKKDDTRSSTTAASAQRATLGRPLAASPAPQTYPSQAGPVPTLPPLSLLLTPSPSRTSALVRTRTGSTARPSELTRTRTLSSNYQTARSSLLSRTASTATSDYQSVAGSYLSLAPSDSVSRRG